MAKGQIAKDIVEKKIRDAFGSQYIGVYDKKIYVWEAENGEQIQIAISLTCPKNQVAVVNTTPSGDYNFEDDAAPATQIGVIGFTPAEITDEERNRINELMAKLNL